jgi:hypothetical protein
MNTLRLWIVAEKRACRGWLYPRPAFYRHRAGASSAAISAHAFHPLAAPFCARTAIGN